MNTDDLDMTVKVGVDKTALAESSRTIVDTLKTAVVSSKAALDKAAEDIVGSIADKFERAFSSAGDDIGDALMRATEESVREGSLISTLDTQLTSELEYLAGEFDGLSAKIASSERVTASFAAQAAKLSSEIRRIADQSDLDALDQKLDATSAQGSIDYYGEQLEKLQAKFDALDAESLFGNIDKFAFKTTAAYEAITTLRERIDALSGSNGELDAILKSVGGSLDNVISKITDKIVVGDTDFSPEEAEVARYAARVERLAARFAPKETGFNLVGGSYNNSAFSLVGDAYNNSAYRLIGSPYESARLGLPFLGGNAPAVYSAGAAATLPRKPLGLPDYTAHGYASVENGYDMVASSGERPSYSDFVRRWGNKNNAVDAEFSVASSFPSDKQHKDNKEKEETTYRNRYGRYKSFIDDLNNIKLKPLDPQLMLKALGDGAKKLEDAAKKIRGILDDFENFNKATILENRSMTTFGYYDETGYTNLEQNFKQLEKTGALNGGVGKSLMGAMGRMTGFREAIMRGQLDNQYVQSFGFFKDAVAKSGTRLSPQLQQFLATATDRSVAASFTAPEMMANIVDVVQAAFEQTSDPTTRHELLAGLSGFLPQDVIDQIAKYADLSRTAKETDYLGKHTAGDLLFRETPDTTSRRSSFGNKAINAATHYAANEGKMQKAWDNISVVRAMLLNPLGLFLSDTAGSVVDWAGVKAAQAIPQTGFGALAMGNASQTTDLANWRRMQGAASGMSLADIVRSGDASELGYAMFQANDRYNSYLTGANASGGMTYDATNTRYGDQAAKNYAASVRARIDAARSDEEKSSILSEYMRELADMESGARAMGGGAGAYGDTMNAMRGDYRNTLGDVNGGVDLFASLFDDEEFISKFFGDATMSKLGTNSQIKQAELIRDTLLSKVDSGEVSMDDRTKELLKERLDAMVEQYLEEATKGKMFQKNLNATLGLNDNKDINVKSTIDVNVHADNGLRAEATARSDVSPAG